MELLRDYALQFVGTPYLWAGDDPIYGYDCSGFVQELLASVGIDPPGDQTAQGLYDHFEKNGQYNVYGLGALAFYGKDAKHVIHVAMMLDPYRIIEAGGGGSKITSKEEAAKANAYIRIRLLKNRSDFIVAIKPRYISIGMAS